MKKLPFLLLCLYYGYASAQTATEMDIYNGLMYAPADMKELKITADSLGLQFKQCKSPFSFTAWHQAPALCIVASTQESLEGLMKDLDKGIDLATLKARYGHWITGAPSAALVAHNNKAFFAGDARSFRQLYTDEAKFAAWSGSKRGNWVYNTSSSYSKKGEFNIITAWQLQGSFQAPVIPETYGQLLAYVDCLVDNSTQPMLRRNNSPKPDENLESLRKYVIKKNNRKFKLMEELPDEDLYNYVCAHYENDNTIRRIADELMLDDMEGYSVVDLAYYVGESIPKEKMLELKRTAQVRGYCSMDDRPRRHARDIAVLASQTHQWPVFIRAHLNIMNDYMERNSDGSYAQARRKTYLKELDELNINTTDLLLGSTLRASNTVPGHYFGDPGRYGRALSEAKDPLAFEARAKKMLKDKQLDDLNKLMIFNLYVSYCYSQPTEDKMKEFKKGAAEYSQLIREGIGKL